MRLLDCFNRHGSDKGWNHGYHDVYSRLLEPLRDQPIRLLEIGVFRGGSIAAWLDYLPNATIIGVDTFQRVRPEEIAGLKHPRVQWFECDSTNGAPDIEPVDFIIDDGDHIQASQLATFRNFFPLLNPCGVYCIEDVLPFDAKQDPRMDTRYPENTLEGYRKLAKAISPYHVQFHDRRKGHGPGSFIIEIRPVLESPQAAGTV